MCNKDRDTCVIAMLTTLLLAGCANSGTSGVPTTIQPADGSRSATQAHAGVPMSRGQEPLLSADGRIHQAGSCPSSPVAFASDFFNNVVYESNTSGNICATISGFSSPAGISVDGKGNVYVANQLGNNVVEFKSSNGEVVKTFNDPGEYPWDVAVDGSGNVAVTNIDNTGGGAGNVVLYAAGSTNPTGRASRSNFTSPRFCAFDKQGNLDLDDLDEFNTNAVNVGVIFKGNSNNMSAVIHPLNGASISVPGGVQVLNTSGQFGTLVILDQDGQGIGAGGTLNTYNSFSYPNLGPATVTKLTGSSSPLGFAFAGSKYTVVADEGGLVELYTYPGGSLVADYTAPHGGTPLGAGVDPTEQF